MYVDWTKHLRDPQEKANFEREILGASNVLSRLVNILTVDEKERIDKMLNENAFTQPDWAYKNANDIGYLNCLRKLKTLVDLDQQRQETPNELTRQSKQ